MSALAALALDVHGLRVEVTGAWPEVLAGLRRDFWWYRVEPSDGRSPDLRVEVDRRSPDFGRFGPLESAFVTPRNAVYQGPVATVVDYFGHAVVEIDRVSGAARAEGEDAALVGEAVGNLLHSRIGEHLNRVGLVRVHGLGLATDSAGIAVVMPSGGGKSSLALAALQTGRCRILSEDSPLVDEHGLLHPFPFRIAVNPTDAAQLPAGWPVRELERLEFHPKLALDVETFSAHVATAPRPLRHLVIGRRTLAERGRLERLPARSAMGPLLRDAVIGIGVYQGMEFVLQRGWRDVPTKGGTAARRARVVARALRGTEVWRLLLGRDRASNWEALAPLL